ncbi:MAG: dihydropteroate synthase [Actinobacteria bacterium]|nr:dihydropteroate synthase [Actinomycetota bacterium]
MGVLNATPDSFSDGGRFHDPEAAIAHGRLLIEQGADIVDVGGESTRPGAQRVPAGEEIARVVPVITALSENTIVSVDTMRARVADAAVEAGASIINDVSGGLADRDMYSVMAQAQIPVVLMHWRAHSDIMNRHAKYQDVVAEVIAELQQRVDAAVAKGVAPERIILDPGLGFAKEAEHNWALLRGLPKLEALGFPVLVGASRKRFLGELLATRSGPRAVAERDTATAAISCFAATNGAWGVRVHDVRATADALAVLAAVVHGPDA